MKQADYEEIMMTILENETYSDWAEIISYDILTDDYAKIMCQNKDGKWQETVFTIDTLKKGYKLIVSGKVEVDNVVLEELLTGDSLNFGDDTVDAILQAGLWGKVKYY